MGARKNIEELITAREELESRMQKLVTQKLYNQANVGRSIMVKKLGWGWSSQELSYLGDLAFWLKAPNSKIVNITADKIEFVNESFKAQRPQGAFSINREIIHLSNRDFAKMLRAKIYQRKAYLKKLELDNATKSIQELEATITKNNREVARLQKLVAAEKELLAKKAEKSKVANAR